MIRSTRSPDTHIYLVDNNNPRSLNALKFSGALGVIVTLGVLSIWAFTPISKEANYKPDLPLISNSINTTATVQEIKLATREAAPEMDNTILPKISDLDDLILDAENDGYLELLTLKLPSGNTAVAPIAVTPTDSPVEAAPENSTTKDSETTSHIVVSSNPADAKAIEAKGASKQSMPTIADKAISAEEAKVSLAVEAAPIAGLNLSTSAQADVREFEIKSGDTLTRIFSNANLPISQAIELSRNKSAGRLNRLSIGKTLRIYYDQNKQLKSLQYDIDKLSTLMVMVQNGEFDIYTHEKQVEYKTFTAQGSIESSLGAATEVAGMSSGLSSDLIDIYKWEIDFARDLQKGDRFSVIYQKAFVEGEYIANGPILAASFSTGGRTIEAIRYTDSDGVTAYFQPGGESLRRGFLRSPVSLARVTSGFGKRLHPIKKTWKKHKGVDYGARRGAPIVATADGMVQYSGKKGGYGNAVILRHGGIYTTLYAHMSKIGKGVRSGKSVTQGQVIGYVGKSGWATGNHLHYEFRVNGQHKDPLKVKLPKTLPLAKQERNEFAKQATAMLATLASIDGTRVAKLAPEFGGPTL